MSTPLRTLVVEDVEDDLMLLLRELRRAGYEPKYQQVQTAAEMSEALRNSDWDLICADYSLPQFSVLGALRELQESGKDIPFLVISGSIGEDLAVGLLRAGAHDFLIKGNWARLGPAIERELRDAGVRRERREAEKTIHERNQQLTILSRRLVEAQEAERRQIARDLHDEIGSLLTALKLNIQQIALQPYAEAESFQQGALRTIDDLIDKVRQMCLDLRPPMLDDLGLISALLWHFQRFTQETAIGVRFEHNMTDRADARTEEAAYRIVQESLTNVARYAGVIQVAVILDASNSWLKIHITDEGAGFDSAAVRSAARTAGISGMVERAALLGGELAVESARGKGTRITARLPLGASQMSRRES